MATFAMSQHAFHGVMDAKSGFRVSNSKEALHPARGWLRPSLTALPGAALLPNIHAGAEVVVLTEAKHPQVFKDGGAFDRRAYLAQKNIDLMATLRAPELIERIASAPPSIGTVLARARRRLRDEIDGLFASTPEVAAVLRAMLLSDPKFCRP